MIYTSQTVQLVNHCFTTSTPRTNRTGRAKRNMPLYWSYQFVYIGPPSKDYEKSFIALISFVVKRFPHKKAKELVQVLENIGHNVTNHSSIADVNGLSYFKEEIVAHGDSRRGGAQGSAQY